MIIIRKSTQCKVILGYPHKRIDQNTSEVAAKGYFVGQGNKQLDGEFLGVSLSSTLQYGETFTIRL